jgi:hypothetical protein
VKENQENCDSLFFQVVFHQVVLQPFSALQQFASHSATITQIIEKNENTRNSDNGMEEKHRAKLDLGTSPTNNTSKKLCQPLGNLIGDPASHLYFTERERGKKLRLCWCCSMTLFSD